MAAIAETTSAEPAIDSLSFLQEYKQERVNIFSCYPLNDSMGPAPKFTLDGMWSWYTPVLNARFEYLRPEGDALHFELVGSVEGEVGIGYFGPIQQWKVPHTLPKTFRRVVIHGANGQQRSFDIIFVS